MEQSPVPPCFTIFYLSLTDQSLSIAKVALGTTNPLVINITIENQWVYKSWNRYPDLGRGRSRY